ncbi:hypothetical protein EON80_25775, partial [bacterium]
MRNCFALSCALAVFLSAQSLGQTSLPSADFAGRAFQTAKAPTLQFKRRTVPRPRGNDYPFISQNARGGALFSRFPAFTLSDRRIHVSGPWYDSPAASDMFSRGITSIEAMPNFRLDPPGLTEVRQL